MHLISSLNYAGGFPNGTPGAGAENPGATGTGMGEAQVTPGGFGAAVGAGQAIATPFGNFAFGQGHAVTTG